MLYLILGLFVGTLGTLIGAGGGFILVPALFFLFPEKTAQQITAISLFCVACNALSGSITYLIQKRVHIRSAVIFALATLPGAYLGVQWTSKIDRTNFEMLFATALAALGIYLITKKNNQTHNNLLDLAITKQKYATGILISFFVGFIASFLGIGGGIIHVPLLSQVLNYPIFLAVGTSHFILVVSSIMATIEHTLNGDLNFSEDFLFYLTFGIIIGAQIGARLSKKIHGPVILRLLGGALIIVALRIFWRSLAQA